MSDYQGIVDIIEREAVELQQKVDLANALKRLGSLADAIAGSTRNHAAILAQIAEDEAKLAEVQKATADAQVVHQASLAQLEQEHAERVAHLNEHAEQLLRDAHAAAQDHAAKSEADLTATLQPIHEQLDALLAKSDALHAEVTALTEARDAALKEKIEADAALQKVQETIKSLVTHASA